MAVHDNAYWDKRIDEIATKAVDKAIGRYEKGWDDKVNESIERAIGVHSEDLKDKMDLVLEATDFIKEELVKKPDREEFGSLKADVSTLKHALTATNKDLRNLIDKDDTWGFSQPYA